MNKTTQRMEISITVDTAKLLTPEELKDLARCITRRGEAPEETLRAFLEEGIAQDTDPES